MKDRDTRILHSQSNGCWLPAEARIQSISSCWIELVAWWRQQMKTGHRAGNSPVHSEFPAHKGQWRGALMFSFICVWINGWVNNREAGDLRRYLAHYDVTVMCRNIQASAPENSISRASRDRTVGVDAYWMEAIVLLESTCAIVHPRWATLWQRCDEKPKYRLS